MKKKELPIKQQMCLACRRCCQSIGMFLDPAVYVSPKKDVAQFYKARGFDVVEQGPLLLLVHQNFPCPNLTEKGCKIYKKRPNICKGYSGIEDFGKKCLWSKLPEHKEEVKAAKKTPKKPTRKKK
jgi:Fe-S-cluster containining protein